ncbi:MAG: hypothetical protein U9Q92_06915 [archaeon]|nr:hypothetical protein [archaeon]
MFVVLPALMEVLFAPLAKAGGAARVLAEKNFSLQAGLFLIRASISFLSIRLIIGILSSIFMFSDL